MMSKFIDWFEGRIKKPQLTGYVYDASKHTGWGNSIDWSDYDNRRVVGWLHRKPVVGDEILFRMKSGKTSRYAVLKVEYCGDPRDMFFADVMDIGYEGEAPINRVKEATKRQVEPKETGLRFLS